MKHSNKSNRLHEEYVDVDTFGHLTDKQKREQRRKLKKAISKLERRENKFQDWEMNKFVIETLNFYKRMNLNGDFRRNRHPNLKKSIGAVFEVYIVSLGVEQSLWCANNCNGHWCFADWHSFTRAAEFHFELKEDAENFKIYWKLADFTFLAESSAKAIKYNGP